MSYHSLVAASALWVLGRNSNGRGRSILVAGSAIGRGMETELSARVDALVKQRFGAASRVDALDPLAGDASTRRYARARLSGPGAPPTAVVMILADRGVAMSSDELAVFDKPPAELPYVNVHNFLVSLGMAVPELYVDASADGLLLLEDVGDVALWDAVQGKPDAEVERLYRMAIDQLLVLELFGTRRPDHDCLAFRQSFDERLYLWEFEHFLEWGLVKRLTDPVPERDLAVLRDHFAVIARYLDRQPRYVNHRDYHSWNLFVHDGRIRVLDFQDALLAAAPYDLATLLGDRDTPSVVRPEIEARLLAYYGEAWEERGGTPWSERELWDVYAACALQKAFKVVGRFHYLNLVKGKPGYLRYLPATLRQIARLLERRPDLAEVRAILARYFPELRG